MCLTEEYTILYAGYVPLSIQYRILKTVLEEPEDYHDLTWEAGSHILLQLATHHPIMSREEFFQRFGYQAIKNALISTFERKDFCAPSCLTWTRHRPRA